MMRTFFLAFVAFFFVQICIAQTEPDTTNLYSIETTDGNEYIGYIIHQDAESVYLKTEVLGEIIIPVNKIKKIQMVKPEQLKGGAYWFENLQAGRYFWAPNGYGLKTREAYYQNVWVMYNQVSVGLTDYFSLAAGTIPLFLFAGAPTPIWVVPKFSIPVVTDKFNVGLGALTGVVLGLESDKPGFGIIFGTATYGSRNSNISFGIGYGFAGGKFASTPIFNLSFMARVSAKTYFISENYVLPLDDESLTIISLGGRSFAKKIGIDYGLFIPFEKHLDAFIALPWLGITVPIGKKL